MSREQFAPIKTKEFALTPDVLFKMAILRRFGTADLLPLFSNGVVIILIIPFALYVIFRVSFVVALLGSIPALIVYGWFVLYPLWRIRQYVHSPDNRGIFEPRYFEIDSTFIAGYSARGEMNRSRLDSVVKAIRTSTYYLLFIAQNLYYYLPLAAFYTVEDIERLEAILKVHGVAVKRERGIEE